jgi:glycosyltransferase involved in cell wall biosynthesis
MSMLARPARIVHIIDGVFRYDAISDHLDDAWHALSGDSGCKASVLTRANERRDLPARLVSGVAELILDRDFLSADLLIYHFGIWDPLFDALLIGNGHARQAVFFHNLTPVSLAPPKDRRAMERSFVQLNNLRRADRLWPVSRTNAELLTGRGFDPALIEILPLAVGSPPISCLAEKVMAPIELLFLGRIVPHKGALDLIEALSRLRCRHLPRFRLRIIGNLAASDAAYSEIVRRAAEGLEGAVEFIGTVDNETRNRMLKAAHILAMPSYHEGFCKPLIEGLRAGCVPVGYAAENLRYTADGLCRMVAPGDVAALAEALSDTIGDVTSATTNSVAKLRLDRGKMTAAEFADAACAHVEAFWPERVRALIRDRVAALLPAAVGAAA